jgi:hypothetical protein
MIIPSDNHQRLSALLAKQLNFHQAAFVTPAEVAPFRDLIMEYGEIYKFEVTATCPHCAEQTDVTQSEMRSKEVQCQHCDESFQVVLDSY